MQFQPVQFFWLMWLQTFIREKKLLTTNSLHVIMLLSVPFFCLACGPQTTSDPCSIIKWLTAVLLICYCHLLNENIQGLLALYYT